MIRLSLQQVEDAAEQLARKIADSGFDPDCLIGITTGGLFPLAMLAKRIVGKRIYTVTTTRHFDGKDDWVTIEYMPIADLEGKSVLLIDEITHIGTTIQTGDGAQQFTVTLDTTNPAYSASLGGYVLAAGVGSINVPVAASTGALLSAGTPTSING